jgi:hypothetical protein
MLAMSRTPLARDRRFAGRRRLLAAAGAGFGLALLHPRRAAGAPRHGDARATARASPAARRQGAEGPAVPEFSDVAQVTPWEALLYLAGRHPRYPGAGLDSIMGYSAANILETTDTDVMDAVFARHGWERLVQVYRLIAQHALDALLAVYGDALVVLALDAGHGGKRGVYYDPGAQGTEADHTRRVVAFIEVTAAAPEYGNVIVRRIFNDDIGDDFGLPPPQDRKSAAQLTIRNVRGSMLAYEAEAWTDAHPDVPVYVHVLSVHFNAGAGGILVLHQGTTVAPVFTQRSVAYAQAYVPGTLAALNASGLMPYPQRLALGTGLSDDRVLYERPLSGNPINPYTGVDRSKLPRRYAMLQSSLHERDYAHGALIYHRLM